jgi:hypothetical protein
MQERAHCIARRFLVLGLSCRQEGEVGELRLLRADSPTTRHAF